MQLFILLSKYSATLGTDPGHVVGWLASQVTSFTASKFSAKDSQIINFYRGHSPDTLQ